MAVKSFSIKVGADTTEFLKNIRTADRQIKTTTRLGDELNKSLQIKFNPRVFSEAQKAYQKALTQTEEKAAALREQLKIVESSGQIDSASYERLQLELAKSEAEAEKLRKKLEEVKNAKIEELADKFEKVGKGIESAGKSLTGFSVAAAGVIAGGAAIAKTASDLGGDIDEMSERFEVSSDTIQRWSYLAIQSGVETETFSRALIRMRAAIADMASGNSTKATSILSSLGITPEQFTTQEDMFNGILQALRSIEDSTLQTAYANEIFGDKIANDMLPYIKIAEETLAKYNAEFDAMPSLTSDQVKELDHLSDSFTRFNNSMKYASAQMGVALAPIMEKVLKLIEEKAIPLIEKLANWFESLSPASQSTILGLLGIIAVAAPLLIMIGKISTGLGALIKLLGTAKAASLATAAGFAALGGALVLGLSLITDWKSMSTVEKILKTLAVAALVAAAAITVFHASWSLGIAIGAIAAGVVAGIAAIKAASDDIGVDAGIAGESSVVSGEQKQDYGQYDLADTSDHLRQTQGGYYFNESSSSNNIDNSVNNNYITIEANEYMNADQLVEVVSRKLAIKKQSRG